MVFCCHFRNSVERTAVILSHHLYVIGLKIVLREVEPSVHRKKNTSHTDYYFSYLVFKNIRFEDKVLVRLTSYFFLCTIMRYHSKTHKIRKKVEGSLQFETRAKQSRAEVIIYKDKNSMAARVGGSPEFFDMTRFWDQRFKGGTFQVSCLFSTIFPLLVTTISLTCLNFTDTRLS